MRHPTFEQIIAKCDELVQYSMGVFREYGRGEFDKGLAKVFDKNGADQLFMDFHKKAEVLIERIVTGNDELSGAAEALGMLNKSEDDYNLMIYATVTLSGILLGINDFGLKRAAKGFSGDKMTVIAHMGWQVYSAAEELFGTLKDCMAQFDIKFDAEEAAPVPEGDVPKGADRKLWKKIEDARAGEVLKCPYNPEHSIIAGYSFCPHCSKRDGKKKDWVIVELPKPKKRRR
ncbi:MAG: hypothetical protein ABH829_02645 [archaeon]